MKKLLALFQFCFLATCSLEASNVCVVKVKVKKFPCSMYQSMYQRHKYNNMPHLIIMFFLFGVAGATPDIGDRCAVGHCENPNDCPRCRAGLMCETAADQMCAGTCYGVCASSTTPSSGGSNNNYHNSSNNNHSKQQ